MEIIFLGTGTSQGIPVIACNCEVCTSTNPKDNRLRTSIYLQKNDLKLVIDSGPDFRYQMLRAHIQDLDAILFTHEHKDHIAGLDDVRAFNFKWDKPMDVYAEDRVITSLQREFYYIFNGNDYPGIPQLNIHSISNEPFSIKGVNIIPIRAYHYKLPVFGFRIDDFIYLTDLKSLPEEELEKFANCDTLVISALRRDEHISHFTLQEALDFIKLIQPKKAYLTHLSHQMGLHNAVTAELPSNVEIAYDGLKLNF